MTEPDQMLTTREVADIFHTSTKWVRAQCASGKFPAHRVGREYRMTRDQLHEAQRITLVQAGRTEPQPRSNNRGPRSYEHLRESA